MECAAPKCWSKSTTVNPHMSEAHCGYTSFHKYVITIVSPGPHDKTMNVSHKQVISNLEECYLFDQLQRTRSGANPLTLFTPKGGVKKCLNCPFSDKEIC